MARKGIVYLDGKRVGTIYETEDEAVRFKYDSDYLSSENPQPISHTLELREPPYETLGLHPFFENLLPQGWLLELATKKLKVPATDTFGLLLATCADCVGAVEVRPAEAPEGDVASGWRAVASWKSCPRRISTEALPRPVSGSSNTMRPNL
jgi:HipA-like protein